MRSSVNRKKKKEKPSLRLAACPSVRLLATLPAAASPSRPGVEEAAGRVDIQRQTNIEDHTQGQFSPAKLSWGGGGGGGVLEDLQRDQLELKTFTTTTSSGCTHRSRPGLIYTAWDALWCVGSWWRRSHSTTRTGRSRSISSTCTVGLGSCPSNTHRS